MTSLPQKKLVVQLSISLIIASFNTWKDLCIYLLQMKCVLACKVVTKCRTGGNISVEADNKKCGWYNQAMTWCTYLVKCWKVGNNLNEFWTWIHMAHCCFNPTRLNMCWQNWNLSRWKVICYYYICQDSTLFEKNCFVNYPLRICSLVMQPYSNAVAWCSKSGKVIGIFIKERFMVIIPIVEGSLSCCF